MLHMLLTILMLTGITMASYCPSNTPGIAGGHCNTVLISKGCSNYYGFSYNSDYQPTYGPIVCEDPGTGAYCADSFTYCLPSCLLGGKRGGPNGLKCGDFTNWGDCKIYYADDSGDRWCAWDPNDNLCYEALICHN